MDITECVYGMMVAKNIGHTMFGMIVGIEENLYHEPIPVVQWQNGQTYGIHPANIKKASK